MNRRTTCIFALVMAGFLAGAPDSANAGGPGFLLPRPDPKVERRDARWRAAPAAAMAELLKAICQNGEGHYLAKELLEVVGKPAIQPLLGAIATHPICSNDAVDVVARILCLEQAAFAPMATALASPRWSRVEAALRVLQWIGKRPEDHPADEGRVRQVDWIRNEPEALFDAAVAPLGRLLRNKTGHERERVVATLAGFGKHAAPLVKELTALLDDEDAKLEAAAALAGIGPAAAQAASSLGRLLANTSAEHSQLGVAYALGQMGAAAAVALPPLHARVQGSMATCTSLDSFPWFLRAVMRIGPEPGDPVDTWQQSMVAQIRIALASMRRCPESYGEPKLMELLATFPAELATRPLVEIMMDDGRAVRRRILAAKAIEPFRTGLHAEESATRQLLLDHPWQAGGSYPLGQGERPPSRSFMAARSFRGAIEHCNTEGGRPATQTAAFLSDQEEEDEQFAECLRERLCGPGASRYLRVMKTCCRYAYGASVPDWCSK